VMVDAEFDHDATADGPVPIRVVLNLEQHELRRYTSLTVARRMMVTGSPQRP
jgi:hypothetical protein